MAKPFKHPQIKTLAVGESCTVFADRKALERSVNAYAKRNGRHYQFDFGEVSHLVTRREDLADPMPDPEPEVA